MDASDKEQQARRLVDAHLARTKKRGLDPKVSRTAYEAVIAAIVKATTKSRRAPRQSAARRKRA